MRLTLTCNPRRVLLLDLASEAGRRCLERKRLSLNHVLWPEPLLLIIAELLNRLLLSCAGVRCVGGGAALVTGPQDARACQQRGQRLPAPGVSDAGSRLSPELWALGAYPSAMLKGRAVLVLLFSLPHCCKLLEPLRQSSCWWAALGAYAVMGTALNLSAGGSSAFRAFDG